MLLKMIQNKEQYDKCIHQINLLMNIDENSLSQEQLEQLNSLICSVHEYEQQHYSLNLAKPHEILRDLMFEQNIQISQLLCIFNSSESLNSVLNGELNISFPQAEQLGELLHVSPKLFIS